MSDLSPHIPPRRKSPQKPKQIVRLLLGETASRILDETGLPAFAVCGCEREPGQPRRWILYLMETRHPAAQEAIAMLKTSAAIERNEPIP